MTVPQWRLLWAINECWYTTTTSMYVYIIWLLWSRETSKGWHLPKLVEVTPSVSESVENCEYLLHFMNNGLMWWNLPYQRNHLSLTQSCMHTHTHTCAHARMHVRVRTHACMYACTHTHTHTHTHTYTHTLTNTKLMQKCFITLPLFCYDITQQYLYDDDRQCGGRGKGKGRGGGGKRWLLTEREVHVKEGNLEFSFFRMMVATVFSKHGIHCHDNSKKFDQIYLNTITSSRQGTVTME